MEGPWLFVDISYVVFYRYFALAQWFQLSQGRPVEPGALESLFLEKYTKLFLETLQKQQKAAGAAPDRVCLAFDCPRESIWRTQIYPAYKETRVAKKSFDPAVFTHVWTVIVPLLRDRGYRILFVPTAEADDIIGTLVHRLRRETPTVPIRIVTSDKDYLQLADAYTTIMNLKNIRLDGDAAAELQYKLLSGDPSDNLPAMTTKRRAAILSRDPVALATWLTEGGPTRLAAYESQRDLVDMTRIPENLREKIEALL